MRINDEDLTETFAFPGLELHDINMGRKPCRQPITAATARIRDHERTPSCLNMPAAGGCLCRLSSTEENGATRGGQQFEPRM
jgi:hypothetical protein